MESRIKHTINFLLVFLYLGITNHMQGHAYDFDFFQDDEQVSSRLSLDCTQFSSGEVELTARLRARIDRQYVDLPNLEITFQQVSDSSITTLGTMSTNESGEAVLQVTQMSDFNPDDEQYYHFRVVFPGNDSYAESEDELAIKRATVEVIMQEQDSIYSLAIRGYEINEEETPVGEQNVIVQVPRMFSSLTIINDYSDEDGAFELDFPNNLPGGPEGELDIIVTLEDTGDYGTLVSKLSTRWGLAFSSESLPTRQLYSPDPPIWMLVTFIILMGLVWGHFAIIVYKMYLIKKESNISSDQ